MCVWLNMVDVVDELMLKEFLEFLGELMSKRCGVMCVKDVMMMVDGVMVGVMDGWCDGVMVMCDVNEDDDDGCEIDDVFVCVMMMMV